MTVTGIQARDSSYAGKRNQDAGKTSAWDRYGLLKHLVPDEGAAEQALYVGVTRGGAIGNSFEQQPLQMGRSCLRTAAALKGASTSVECILLQQALLYDENGAD